MGSPVHTAESSDGDGTREWAQSSTDDHEELTKQQAALSQNFHVLDAVGRDFPVEIVQAVLGSLVLSVPLFKLWTVLGRDRVEPKILQLRIRNTLVLVLLSIEAMRKGALVEVLETKGLWPPRETLDCSSANPET